MGSSECQLLPPRGRGGLRGLRGHVMAQSAGSTALAGGGRGSAGNAARPQRERAPPCTAAAAQPDRGEASPLQSPGSGAGRAWGMLPGCPMPSLPPSLCQLLARRLGRFLLSSSSSPEAGAWPDTAALPQQRRASVVLVRPSLPTRERLSALPPPRKLSWRGGRSRVPAWPRVPPWLLPVCRAPLQLWPGGRTAAPSRPAPAVAARSLGHTSAVVFTAYLTLLRSPSVLQLSDW